MSLVREKAKPELKAAKEERTTAARKTEEGKARINSWSADWRARNGDSLAAYRATRKDKDLEWQRDYNRKYNPKYNEAVRVMRGAASTLRAPGTLTLTLLQ